MKKRIICYGDSNTWGFHPLGNTQFERYSEEVRWTGRLQKLLGEEYTIIEEGLNGRASVWYDPVENRMDGLTYLLPCMATHFPFDLLIIMLGSNDTKKYFGLQTKTIAEGVGRLVETALKSDFGRKKKAPKVLLIAPARIDANVLYEHILGEQAAEKSKDFPETYQEIAERFGCHFLDASKVVEPGKIDGIHFDEQGHKKFADAVYQKVKEILS